MGYANVGIKSRGKEVDDDDAASGYCDLCAANTNYNGQLLFGGGR